MIVPVNFFWGGGSRCLAVCLLPGSHISPKTAAAGRVERRLDAAQMLLRHCGKESVEGLWAWTAGKKISPHSFDTTIGAVLAGHSCQKHATLREELEYFEVGSQGNHKLVLISTIGCFVMGDN